MDTSGLLHLLSQYAGYGTGFQRLLLTEIMAQRFIRVQKPAKCGQAKDYQKLSKEEGRGNGGELGGRVLSEQHPHGNAQRRAKRQQLKNSTQVGMGTVLLCLLAGEGNFPAAALADDLV
jgi:hypothetical protein